MSDSMLFVTDACAEMITLLCAKYNWKIVRIYEPGKDYKMQLKSDMNESEFIGSAGSYIHVNISAIQFCDDDDDAGTDDDKSASASASASPGYRPDHFNLTINNTYDGSGDPDDDPPKQQFGGVYHTYFTNFKTQALNYTGSYGICCMCGSPCNAASQTCGRCPRNLWH